MKHYDHHEEVYQAEKEMERAERAQRLSEMAADDENHAGQYELQEFDSLTADKKLEGELVVRSNKYLSREDEAIELAQINVREASETQLIFRKMPFAIWFAGFLICLMGLYLIYHLALGHYGVLFHGFREQHWWQYALAIGLLIFGLVFMFAGKIESVVFNKQVGIMSMVTTNIFCNKTSTDWALDQIKNLKVYKRGHDGVQVMTIRYEVQINFNGLPSHTILTTNNKEKAIRQLVKIKDFLGLPLNRADLKVKDESTSKFGRRKV